MYAPLTIKTYVVQKTINSTDAAAQSSNIYVYFKYSF